GSQVRLYHRAFVPAGWSYTISDTGLMTVPDTILVTITHPVPMACEDTGRVFVYAYTPAEGYIGDAEATTYRRGLAGDVNSSGVVNSLDVFDMAEWILGEGPEPLNADAMDTNSDGRVDVADLTRLVDAVYDGGALTCDPAAATQPYGVRYS